MTRQEDTLKHHGQKYERRANYFSVWCDKVEQFATAGTVPSLKVLPGRDECSILLSYLGNVTLLRTLFAPAGNDGNFTITSYHVNPFETGSAAYGSRITLVVDDLGNAGFGSEGLSGSIDSDWQSILLGFLGIK